MDLEIQKARVREEFLTEKDDLMNMYKWMRYNNRTDKYNPNIATTKEIEEFEELFKSGEWETEKRPLLLRFWLANDRIRKFSGQLENQKRLATDEEIYNFFRALETRARNQGIYDDGQSRWPKRIKLNSDGGDTLFNFDKYHPLNGMLGGNEWGAGPNYPIVGLGMSEPIGLLKELTEEETFRYTIIINMDGKKDNFKVG